MRTLFVGLFFFTAILADAQVVVTSVFNVGDTSENLCPGLEVAIIGSNLGAFGAQSTVTVGGQQAQIIQDGSGTVFAVLPADLPVGPTTLTVTYNGQTSAPFPITLVAYAPAIGQETAPISFPPVSATARRSTVSRRAITRPIPPRRACKSARFWWAWAPAQCRLR
jgi:uncharacterized protein (TIGR03437 family)